MDMLRWIIAGDLAAYHRPGYQGERGSPVAREQVDEWIAEVALSGIRSILCLLGEDQLSLYDSLPGSLIEYYQDNGFNTGHVPARDHQMPALDEDQLAKVWQLYQALPKPVLIHCSAGIDRTRMATRHIVDMVG